MLNRVHRSSVGDSRDLEASVDFDVYVGDGKLQTRRIHAFWLMILGACKTVLRFRVWWDMPAK